MDGPARADERAGSTARDSHEHHAALWSALVRRTDALTEAVRAGENDLDARLALVDFLRGDVRAHLAAEERVLYGAARQAGARDLASSLEADHRFLLGLVEEIGKADTAMEAVLSARALVVLFALRMEKEDTVVLPALARAGVDVTALLEGVIVAMATDYDAQFTYL